MTSMSTPIQQLPQGAAPPATAKLDEDPAVNDVINEMTMEFNTANPAPTKHVTAVPHQPVVTHASPSSQPFVVTPVMPSSSAKTWFDTEHAKRAAIVAVVAFIMLHPYDLSQLYEKIPMLYRVASYDRYIRVVVLAVALYVLFWKLNI